MELPLFLNFNIVNTITAVAATPIDVNGYSLKIIPTTIAVYINTKPNTAWNVLNFFCTIYLYLLYYFPYQK